MASDEARDMAGSQRQSLAEQSTEYDHIEERRGRRCEEAVQCFIVLKQWRPPVGNTVTLLERLRISSIRASAPPGVYSNNDNWRALGETEGLRGDDRRDERCRTAVDRSRLISTSPGSRRRPRCVPARSCRSSCRPSMKGKISPSSSGASCCVSGTAFMGSRFRRRRFSGRHCGCGARVRGGGQPDPLSCRESAAAACPPPASRACSRPRRLISR